jgi:hypothetical protein
VTTTTGRLADTRSPRSVRSPLNWSISNPAGRCSRRESIRARSLSGRPSVLQIIVA